MSRSTPEPEIAAMDAAIGAVPLPLLAIAEEVSGVEAVDVRGANQAMLSVPKTGRSPTMRHLSRTHRVSVA